TSLSYTPNRCIIRCYDLLGQFLIVFDISLNTFISTILHHIVLANGNGNVLFVMFIYLIKGVNMQIINSILSAGIQLVLFSIIPFIWWFIFYRRNERFFKWIGLKKPVLNYKSKNRFYPIIIAFVFLSISLFSVTLFVDNTTSEFTNFGFVSILAAILTAFIRTGLAEEIFFRGFLAKRLIYKYGYQTGNMIQA